MELEGQSFSGPRMISKKSILLLQSLLLLTSTVEAAPESSCSYVEQSVSTGRAVTSDAAVLVAIRAIDSGNTGAKVSSKDIKRKLQMIFISYCKEFSGYKYFQITTKAGVSGSVKCNDNIYYVFSVLKSNITISELASSERLPTVDIPEIGDQKDVFEDFR
jgi:hypothetical protein